MALIGDDGKSLIGIGMALKEGARLLDLYLQTDEGKAKKKELLKKLRQAGAYKTAAMIQEAEKVAAVLKDME